jgi:ADP-ribose pyrophosphatase
MSDQRRTLFETRRFSVVELTCRRPDGQAASCRFVEHPGSVAILPLLDDNRLCLIHSRRLTVAETLIELPAGTREPAETPLQTAQRELNEETGYRAANMEEFASYYPSPGVLSERMWIFIARNLVAGEPAREPNEEIQNLIVTWQEAFEMIDRGQIRDGKTLTALLLYDRRRRLNGATK